MFAAAKINLNGNLTHEPEVADVNGKQVCSFSIAVNTGKRNEDGTFIVDYYRISSWNSVDYLMNQLMTGTNVDVCGSVVLGAYISKKDGLPHPDARVTAFDVQVRARGKGWKKEGSAEGAA